MPTLTLDGKTVTVEPGATILEAAEKLGIRIPTLCHLRGLPPFTTCMVCLVKVQGMARLLPSCATKAHDGMVVESESDDVRAARRTALELLLSDHLGDCVGPCQSACPAHMDIPLMIRQLAAGQWRDAIATVKEQIALPAVLGRICPEICERGCRRAQVDAPIGICRLKRFAADVDLASGSPYAPDCKADTGRKVAIVGAGPAGLSAAWYLRREGCGCVVFDEHDRPGGQLRAGVDRERLPLDALDAEIAAITRLGVEFRGATRIADWTALDALRREFDAVLLACGEITAEQADALGLSLRGRGLQVDSRTLETPVAGVFAAGSMVTPSRHAVRAGALGRRAALTIARRLRGEAGVVEERPYTVHIGRLHDCEIPMFRAEGSPAARVQPAGGAFAGFEKAEMQIETARCLHCDCDKLHSCDLRRHSAEYDASGARFKGERRPYEKEFTHPHVVFEPGKCIGCGRCVAIAAKAEEKLGLAFQGRGFTMRVKVPFDESIAAGLTVVARECADACPTAALSWRERGVSDQWTVRQGSGPADPQTL